MMKKLVLILLITLLMPTFCSCGDAVVDVTKLDTELESDTAPTTDTVTDTADTLDADSIKKEYYIDKKDGGFDYVEVGSELTLKLPNSNGKATVDVREEVKDYISLIDRDLYNTAIADFFRQIKASDGLMKNYPLIWIAINDDNYVSISMECIVNYDPPHTDTYDGEVMSGGCGIDHDHIQVWYTPISYSKIK